MGVSSVCSVISPFLFKSCIRQDPAALPFIASMFRICHQNGLLNMCLYNNINYYAIYIYYYFL